LDSAEWKLSISKFLLDLVRAKRNNAFAVGDNERLRQELNDLRKLHQDLVEKSNQTIADLTKDRDDEKRRNVKEKKKRSDIKINFSGIYINQERKIK
jgi:hypothetical protein